MDYQHLLLQYGLTAGYLIAFFIIFAESGLFFGFFFPGDSLLFPLGILAAQGYFSFWKVLALMYVASVAGNAVGYVFGARLGPALFKRPDSRLFNKAHLEEAQAFYEKHGRQTIFLARFVPVVRTFAPIVAGIGKMDYRLFMLYNMTSGVVWIGLIVSAGYYLGNRIPGIDRYTLPIIALIILVSMLPALPHLLKKRQKN